MTYSNLSTRSHYSCGLGIGTSKEFIKQAKELGLRGIAITDRHTAAGLLDFYHLGRKEKFPVALGSELYYFDGMNRTNRFIVIARTQQGYHNICKLITHSWNNAEQYKMPAVSLYDLREYSSDLYCITSHLSNATDLLPIFGEWLIYEVVLDSRHQAENARVVESGRPFVITSDAYMPTAGHKVLQDIMIVNNSRGFSTEPFTDVKPLMSSQDIVRAIVTAHPYLKDPSKIQAAFDLSNAIMDECSKIELKFKDQVVNYPHRLHPLNHDGCTKNELVRRIVKANGRLKDDPVYVERLEYELDSIQNNGRVDLIDYFLVLEDVCRFCRDNDITVGPGRGSGAGSLVNYCLKITHLDPIQHKLLFERFISKGRIQKGTLPDVDLDFSDPEAVRVYLREMYGDERVIRIGTFQTLKTLGSIKDIMRYEYPDVDFGDVNAITTSFSKKEQEETELEFYQRNLEENDKVRAAFKKYPKVADLVEKLVGYARQPGGHPCGLAITQDNIEEFAPIRVNKGEMFLELTMDYCEKSGIIKYDILGLKTLKYIQTCMKLAGIEDLYSIPTNDRQTFEGFCAGKTTATFQFNSDVSIGILTQLPVEKMSLDILCMATAAGRPGPMKNGIHMDFIRRVQGKAMPTAPHPALAEELKETYGLMIYQESVMKASQILGGFSLAEADDIRKAMGKKIASVLEPYKDRFVKHCEATYPETKEYHVGEDNDSGIKQTVAEHIWNLMATFSGYGFNKSHSMAYALIGYYCQYLKTHHPKEWWIACMTHADSAQLQEYYQECSEMTLNPDINLATNDYFIDANGMIQMPFTCLKGLGPKASEEIVACRPYTSFQDFFDRVNKTRVNKSVVEKLIFSGCFDTFEPDMQVLIDQYYKLRGEKVPENMRVLTKSTIAEARSKSLSFLSMDYYKIYPHLFPETETTPLDQLTNTGGKITIGGIVKKVEKKKTKGGKDFANVTISNDGVEVKVRLWSEELTLYASVLEEKNILCVVCNTSEYNNQLQLTAVNVRALTKEMK